LDYHKDYYSENGKPSKGKKDNPLTPDGHLTTSEKKRILLNNIYGVDLDANAVEVTKLSLLLKCLEGETEASIKQQLSIWNERVLPTLDSNIKDGNSLVDIDIYANELDLGFEKKIKPFRWEDAFPEILKSGGFDAIIGNPPYVRQELLGDQKDYFQKKYAVFHGVADLYCYFIEKSIQLLSDNGLYGVIVANKWMRTNFGEPLRKWLKNKAIYQIIDFGDLPVFNSVTTYPCILIIGKQKPTNNIRLTLVKSLLFNSLQEYVNEHSETLNQKTLLDNGWNLASIDDVGLLEKLHAAGISFEQYVNKKVFRGIVTGFNEAFIIDEETRKKLITEDSRCIEIIKPFLAGKDVKRYQSPNSHKYLIFTRQGIDIDKYPAIKAHLEQYKKYLMPKPCDYKGDKWEGRKPGKYKWYEIQDRIEYYKEFEKSKIVYPNILKRPEFTYDTEMWYTNQKCFIIPTEDKYLLGVLNSKITHYLFDKLLPKLRGGFFEPNYVIFKNFPIRKIDQEDESEVSLQNEVIKSVDRILLLYKEKERSSLQSKMNQLNSKISFYEKRIDKILYELYGLNTKEIDQLKAL
jgi:hypothetical protein